MNSGYERGWINPIHLGIAVLLGVVAALLIGPLGFPEAMVALTAAPAVALALPGFATYWRNRDPDPPQEPTRLIARERNVGPEPPPLIYEMATNCVICGRPLTNPQSQMARVGSTCIKTYGPRPRMIENPAHAEWRRQKTAAEVDRIAEQVRLDARINHEMAAYRTSLTAWETELRSPAGVERQRVRRQGVRQMVGGAAAAGSSVTTALVVLALL